MSKKNPPYKTTSQNIPPVEWDSSLNEFWVRIQNTKETRDALRPGKDIDLRYKPRYSYVSRIREKGSEEWSPGFCSPLTQCTFVDLKVGTEYELEIRTKDNITGLLSEPVLASTRTLTKPELDWKNIQWPDGLFKKDES